MTSEELHEVVRGVDALFETTTVCAAFTPGADALDERWRGRPQDTPCDHCTNPLWLHAVKRLRTLALGQDVLLQIGDDVAAQCAALEADRDAWRDQCLSLSARVGMLEATVAQLRRTDW